MSPYLYNYKGIILLFLTTNSIVESIEHSQKRYSDRKLVINQSNKSTHCRKGFLSNFESGKRKHKQNKIRINIPSRIMLLMEHVVILSSIFFLIFRRKKDKKNNHYLNASLT